MVTVEVNLKEGEEIPEQQLDEGEYIERVMVPLSQLYDKLQGTSHQIPYRYCAGADSDIR
jgi:ADP-ribose pyrophosphatase